MHTWAGASGALRLQRYVQVHTLSDSADGEAARTARGNMEPPYDGVAELWWAQESHLEEALTTQQGQAAAQALLEDEHKFIDHANSPLWLAHEYPQINPTPENIVARTKSSIVKVHFPVRHLRKLDETAARQYWLHNHGPVIRQHAPASGILCYRQVHSANHPLVAALREARGTEVDGYLGHAEAWVDMARASVTEEARVANRAAIEDEARFVDFERSTLFLAKEQVLVDRS